MNDMNNLDVSIISPAYNEEDNIFELYERINNAIPKKYSWEIIFVDDGSTDGTSDKIKELCTKNKRVKYLKFSRNYGHQIALTAGYDYAFGRSVISIDSDLQHPPEIIPKMLELWENGNEIIFTRRTNANLSWFKKVTSKLFYLVFNKIANTNIVGNSADFRLIDQKVVKYLRKYRELNRFVRGIVGDLGFKRAVLDYEEDCRKSGKTKYSTIKMMKFALSGIVSFSSFPLVISFYIGAAIAFISFFHAIWIIYDKIVYGAPVGIASILVGIFFFGGVQLISIGMLGEYISKIYTEVKRRPLYCVDHIIGINEKEV